METEYVGDYTGRRDGPACHVRRDRSGKTVWRSVQPRGEREMTVTVDTSSPGEGEDVAACHLSRRSCRPSLAPLQGRTSVFAGEVIQESLTNIWMPLEPDFNTRDVTLILIFDHKYVPKIDKFNLIIIKGLVS